MLKRCVVAGVVFACGVARAQPGASEPPPEPAPAPAPPPVDPTVAAYDAAFKLLADGHPDQAAALFDRIATESPDPMRAQSARELGRLARTLWEKHARYELGDANAKLKAELEADDGDDGRTSFITFTTIYGLYAGIVVVDDLNIDDLRGGILTVAAGTAAGLLGSYFGTKDTRITGSMGDAYGMGMIFGVANAGLLMEPIDHNPSSEQVTTTLLVAGAVGGIAGIGLASAYEPTRGQVSFASTLGILGFASTGLALAITQPSIDSDNLLVAMAGGMDVGLAAGVVLGRDLDWSVSRGRIVTLGTLLGGLTGAAAGALIVGDDPSSGDGAARTLAALTLAGTWGGFGLTTHLTSGMRPDRRYAPQPTTQLTAIPVRHGAGLGLTGTF
jgi:hypothetical protein